MFRFSIRDLLWLTLVVALGLGWWLRERDLRAEVGRASSRADWWRMGAGALEQALRDDHWAVKWDLESSEVIVTWPPGEDDLGPLFRMTYDIHGYEPSTKEQ